MTETPAHEGTDGEFARLRDFPRDVHSRRFLASLLVTSRYHVASRPMSYSNIAWFRGLAAQCDALRIFLREGDWERLEAPVEDGLEELQPLAPMVETWIVDRQARRRARRRWLADFHTRFSSLNVAWSRLAPSDELSLDDWPAPKRIYVVIGPNIGIGDQLIYFPIVEGLAARFPAARVEAIGFTPSLWDLCPSVAPPATRAHTLVGPFVLARDAIATEPDTLVVFSEFASAPFYRNLETVPGLPRFVFFDSGARCVRIVDQARGLIREWEGGGSGSVFSFCCQAMAWLGLGRPAPGGYGPVVNGPLRPMAPVRRVYVNPFSSKDHTMIPASFWAGALDEAAKRGPIHATIFAGTNDACRDFARAIAARVRAPNVATSLHGETDVPTIADTVAATVEADATLGLDTYTAHSNVLKASRSVVVFFEALGGSWDAWRSPHVGVLNASIHDAPAHVGRLLGRLLFDDRRADVCSLARALHDRHRKLAALASGLESGTAADALGLARDAASLVRKWSALDPELLGAFGEIDPALAEPLLRVFGQAAEAGATLDAPLRKLVADGLRLFEETNLWRYVRLLATVESPRVARDAPKAHAGGAPVSAALE